MSVPVWSCQSCGVLSFIRSSNAFEKKCAPIVTPALHGPTTKSNAGMSRRAMAWIAKQDGCGTTPIHFRWALVEHSGNTDVRDCGRATNGWQYFDISLPVRLNEVKNRSNYRGFHLSDQMGNSGLTERGTCPTFGR